MIVDFHSHILPEMDDGSSSVSESIAMLRMEADQGIKHVVATPHFYAKYDTPERFLARCHESEMRLRDAMVHQSGLPTLSIGAEVHFFNGMSFTDALQQLTIDQNGCILLEMPVCRWTESMYQEMENIWIRQGITPVIAHIERYFSPLQTDRMMERLAKMPVYVQANASFFLSGSTRRTALKMLKADRIHVLGSDCHNLQHRLPNLGAAIDLIERSLPQGVIERIGQYQKQILKTI